jgi:signal transduction histidine kinase
LTNHIELWVKDTGIGIPPDELPQLFSRFHRGRNAANYPGNGLGLAIIKAIIEGHKGHVHVESGAQGTHFLLQLPITS